MIIAAASFGLAYVFQSHSTFALILLVIVAITLDMAVSGNLVLGQRIIYSLGSEARGRVNGIFMSIFLLAVRLVHLLEAGLMLTEAGVSQR